MASAVNTVQPAASSLLSPPRLTAHCQAGLGGPVRCLHSSTADSRAQGYVTTWHSAYVSVLLSTEGVTNFDNDTVKAYLLTYWSSHTLGIFAKWTFKQVVSHAEIGILVYKTIAKVFHVEKNPLKMLFYVKALVPCLLCMYPSQ